MVGWSLGGSWIFGPVSLHLEGNRWGLPDFVIVVTRLKNFNSVQSFDLTFKNGFSWEIFMEVYNMLLSFSDLHSLFLLL